MGGGCPELPPELGLPKSLVNLSNIPSELGNPCPESGQCSPPPLVQLGRLAAAGIAEGGLPANYRKSIGNRRGAPIFSLLGTNTKEILCKIRRGAPVFPLLEAFP